MEVSSDRAVATVEMSELQSKDGDPLDADADYESLPPHVSVTTHMTAGAVAGILEHTVMYPVDSVKVTGQCGVSSALTRSTDPPRSLATTHR